jgi:hypothetical protein
MKKKIKINKPKMMLITFLGLLGVMAVLEGLIFLVFKLLGVKP